MSTLVDIIKTIAGRKLPAKIMIQAPQRLYQTEGLPYSEKPTHIDEIERLPFAKYHRFIQEFDYSPSHKGSDGSTNLAGYYPRKTISRWYNKEGLITHESTYEGDYRNGKVTSVTNFEPPGRLFVRKIKFAA